MSLSLCTISKENVRYLYLPKRDMVYEQETYGELVRA